MKVTEEMIEIYAKAYETCEDVYRIEAGLQAVLDFIEKKNSGMTHDASDWFKERQMDLLDGKED